MQLETTVFVAVTLLATFASTSWLGVASRYFGNLNVYLLAARGDEEVVASTKSKKSKKGASSKKATKDFPNLAVIRLSRAASYEIKHFSTFDQGCCLVFGIAANCIVMLVFSSWLKRNTMLPGMCMVSFFLCIYNMMYTVFLDQTTPRFEKFGLLALFSVGFGATYYLLHSKPEWILDSGSSLSDSVGKTLSALNDVLREKKVFADLDLDVSKVLVPEHLTKTLVSVLAGHVSACVFPAALRMAQMYQSVTSSTGVAYQWGAKYLQSSEGVRLLWHATIAGPLLLIASTGMAKGGSKEMSTGGALVVIACHLVIIRPMLQAFLNRGLIEWNDTKSSSNEAEVLDILAKYLKSALQRRLYVLGKVSVQSITFPLLLISLLPLQDFSMLSGASGKTRTPGQGQFLWELVGSYLLWWACLTWSLVFIISLYTLRMYH